MSKSKSKSKSKKISKEDGNKIEVAKAHKGQEKYYLTKSLLADISFVMMRFSAIKISSFIRRS